MLSLVELCRAAWNPGRLAWYVAPTYKQAKRIAWNPGRAGIAVQQYQASNDSLAAWLDEHTIASQEATVPQSELHAAYVSLPPMGSQGGLKAGLWTAS
jgi:hypothetical protein